MNERGRRFSHLSWHNRLKIEKMLKEATKRRRSRTRFMSTIPQSIERSSAA